MSRRDEKRNAAVQFEGVISITVDLNKESAACWCTRARARSRARRSLLGAGADNCGCVVEVERKCAMCRAETPSTACIRNEYCNASVGTQSSQRFPAAPERRRVGDVMVR